MVYKAKRVSLKESHTYYTILMPDYDGDMVLSKNKNNWNECMFTTSLMKAKRFATEEKALTFLSDELKGSINSYKVIPIKVEVSIEGLNN